MKIGKKKMKVNKLQQFNEFIKVNESESEVESLRKELERYKELLEEARESRFNKEKDLEIYRGICNVGGWHIGQLQQAAKAWDVRISEAIEYAKDSTSDIEWDNFDSMQQYIVDEATNQCGVIAYQEEFEDFDWEDLDIDSYELLDQEAKYEGNIYIDIDGDGDYEEAYGRDDLREMFERAKLHRLQNQIEWEDEDDDEE